MRSSFVQVSLRRWCNAFRSIQRLGYTRTLYWTEGTRVPTGRTQSRTGSLGLTTVPPEQKASDQLKYEMPAQSGEKRGKEKIMMLFTVERLTNDGNGPCTYRLGSHCADLLT